jgi:hypothetical protein
MRRFVRWLVAVAIVVMSVAVTFVGITTITGFHGPGWLQRYSRDDLDHLADKINAQPAGVDGCGTTQTRPRAHVDLLRSRIIIDERGPMLMTPAEQKMVSGVPLFARTSCDML